MKIKSPEMSDSGNWNVVTGCTPISDGCKNCFAKSIAEDLAKKGFKKYVKHGFNVFCDAERLDYPMVKLSKRPRRPGRIFVSDMGDVFHRDVPDDFIKKIFNIMYQVPQHIFYLLTKRSERLKTLNVKWWFNIWVGVSVESKKYLYRIDDLRQLPVEANKFIMFEPLLGNVGDIDLSGIKWVIVGGETGKHYREMKIEWVRNIRDQAKKAGIPFMFKHWAGFTHNMVPALLDGRYWSEFPKGF